MVGGLVAVGGGLQLAGMVLGVGNQVLQRVKLAVCRHQHQRSLVDVVADGHEVLHGVVAQALHDVGAQGGQVHEAQGIAVGLGLGQGCPADGAGAALLVVDDDGLADVLVGVGAEDAGGVVGAGAGLVGHDHVHGLAGGPAGGGGFAGTAGVSIGGRRRGAGIAASAGAQAQQH